MKYLGAFLAVGMSFYGLAGCSRTSTKSPDVSGAVRQSLDQSGLKDVSVSDDRDNGVVTLGGHVARTTMPRARRRRLRNLWLPGKWWRIRWR